VRLEAAGSPGDGDDAEQWTMPPIWNWRSGAGRYWPPLTNGFCRRRRRKKFWNGLFFLARPAIFKPTRAFLFRLGLA